MSDDVLGTMGGAFSGNWDWKGDYVSNLSDDGYERFSQYSATPDTTAIFAGPARFTGLAGDTTKLIPVGLTDGLQYSSNVQLARLFEIGSNRSFFTRGKSAPYLTFGKMIADQKNILSALMASAEATGITNSNGSKAPGDNTGKIMMNLDSEYFSVPFGVLLVFKTRGGLSNQLGKILAGVYLEYCMFENYNFGVSASAPVIMENVQIQFDRPVPVSFG